MPHGLAQWAVNMYQGELYGYANYIHLKKMIPAGVMYFWEDIVCKYWKWAEKAGGMEGSGMRPALSVMHAKAHNWTCQVIWGGRLQDGSACSTEVEAFQGNSNSVMRLQDEIEMLVSAIEQTTHSMNRLADSSKQRTRLRKKYLQNKSKLSSQLEKYNVAISEHEDSR
ncbi:hypothetical protein OS493_000003 [Desmophyllum pertusum]|uniref:Uncharacterized protein n=1 Tax=Desmophyllum pertusum TaxID=174260 RepID=A0A9X0A699_9CNID|nr:hypothetical protein OS493_000003 [Desmophyllum pertusum]